MPRSNLGGAGTRAAFTLIELLVVIAIIAILAAILFPVFAQAKVAAKKAVDISNFKQVDLGTIMYQNDADDVYPLLRQGIPQWGCNNASNGAAIDCQQVINAAVAVNPYVKNRQVWASPNDSIFRNDCPGGSSVNNPGGTLSYAYNYSGMNRADGAASNPYALGLVGWDDNHTNGSLLGSSTPSLNESQVDMPADTVLMYPYYATFSYYNGLQAYSIDGRRVIYPDASIGGIALWTNVDVGPFWCTSSDEIAIGAYGTTTNWGFADGHVKSQERSQLMDYNWVTNPTVAIANHLRNKLAASGIYHQ